MIYERNQVCAKIANSTTTVGANCSWLKCRKITSAEQTMNRRKTIRGDAMISVWWLIPAFMVGATVGIFLLALMIGNKDDK